MSEELNPQAGEPAPEPGPTASPEPANPGSLEGAEEPQPKTFTQEELEAAIGKRLAKERRAWERQQRQVTEETQRPANPLPDPSNFKSIDEYADALADHKLMERETRKRMTEVEMAFDNREDEARGKYDDYEAVTRNPDLRITVEMMATIQESEIGPEIAYHLGMHPDEASRIAKLGPLAQAREIGKIEASLAANPPVKKASSAPDPIKPVGTRSSTPSYDTTDPRSIKAMTASEWIEAERRRQMKKFSAQN